MELVANKNFETLEMNQLENIDGGISKNDLLGIYGSAAWVGGIVVGCFNPPLGMVIVGSGLGAWDNIK